MCGIAGQLCPTGLPKRNPELYRKILDTMRRRGPDQEGQYRDEACALLHRRLSVIDPEHGMQPMTIDGRTIVYNGELYNAPQLRRELIAHGQHFQTSCDTEVLLRAWNHWGENCLSRLNGIFAFAVYEENTRRLFFARDAMGVKPLFYALRGNSLYFASELKSLLCFPEISPDIDRQGIYELMLLGPGKIPDSGVFRDVHSLAPGQWGEFDEKGLTLHTYWQLEDRPFTDSFEEAAQKTRYLVEDSIERQLFADVPVGTFLSGGLDSSIVSAVAAKKLGKLNTYSVDYKDNDRYFKATKFQPNSDTHFMLLMAEHIGAHSHFIQLDTEPLVKALFEAAEARDLPGMADVDSSMLLLCRQAKESSTVVLSGECADEIFGGYPWFRDPEIRAAEGFPWAQNTDYRASFLSPELISHESPQDFVLRQYTDTLKTVHVLPDTSPTEKRMKEMMVLNLRWFMQTLLSRKDHMSMWSGLEIRVPFCDKRIVEYLYTVPWAYKEHGGMEKGLLRHAFRDLLPDEVLYRKKSPYPKTWNPAYMQTVSALLREELDGTNSPLLSFLKKEELLKLCTENRSIPWYGQLMTTPQTIAYFLQMAHWMRVNQVRIVS